MAIHTTQATSVLQPSNDVHQTPDQTLTGSRSNGQHNSDGHSSGTPLNILIVGAGIGGLSAAVFLRQQGHNVTLLEQSRFANELGAAIHLAPNANVLLDRMGIDAAKLGAVPCRILTTATSQMDPIFSSEVWRMANRWTQPWLLGHRVDLHTELKNLATSTDGEGTAAVLRTSTRVAKVTTDGTVTLESGEELHADLVIGADGVHSKCRYAIPQSHGIEPFGSGKSAFRFLIPRSQVVADPETYPIVAEEGQLYMFIERDRRVVIYPTRNNEWLNFVCIHPTAESERKKGMQEDWETAGDLARLLQIYKSFHATILKILSMAGEQTLKVWDLLDMAELPTWTEGRLALLGDAAHPFTPHQGQGAAQAIEDAASLACVLPLGVPKEEISDRLKLYESCRRERASRIQEYSRISGRDLGDGPPLDQRRYVDENFGHDEWDHTTQKLREWSWARQPSSYRRIPIAFGPAPGPRHDHLGRSRDWSKTTFRTASIKFRTSRTLLQNLLPTSDYRFASADTACFATFSVTSLGNLDWLGGHGYNFFGLFIHGVEVTSPNGRKVLGTYLPVLFEDLADPIITGRDELGMPKLYCDLHPASVADTFNLTASWKGATFLNFTMTGLKEQTAQGVQNNTTVPSEGNEEGLLFHKYLPTTAPPGSKSHGTAEVDYAGIVPNAEEAKAPRKVSRTRVAQNATVQLDALDWKKLPTLHHVIERLQEIPIYEVVQAKVVEGTGASDVRGAQRLL